MHSWKRGILALMLAITMTSAGFAQPPGTNDGGSSFDIMSEVVRPLVLAVIFTVIGLLLFGACIWLIVRLTPFSVRKEIEEDQNIAMGIIIGSMILGIAIILSAALLG